MPCRGYQPQEAQCLPADNRYELGAFSRNEAIQMFSRVVKPNRVEAEPEAVDALCRLCGDLPLALRIVAARLVARPHWSVASLVERLADGHADSMS